MNDRTKADLLLLENLTVEKRLIDGRIDELKANLISQIPVGTAIEAESGTFSVSVRSKWRYSPELEAREKAVKESKKTEEQTGVAVESKGDPFISYRENA